MFSFFYNNSLLKIFYNSVVALPTPKNISFFWNFGSLLGLCLLSQIITGVFLSLHYSSDASLAFFSVSHIMRDVNYGWVVRVAHANGASMFFICVYCHLFRGLYYYSFKLVHVWLIGVSILLMLMATAFLGYVLPWGQMSFWGATVITNLFSAIPYLGSDIVYWLWGGFAVSSPTLSRFFGLHYLLPFVLTGLVLIHLLFLHQVGSSNPLGMKSDLLKIKFNPYFIWKDYLGFILYLWLFMILVYLYPWVLGDSVNFVEANPLSTPLHIQPEWYFLFAYAILRSIPNKLGGVLALVLSVLVFYMLPFISVQKFSVSAFCPFFKLLFWVFLFLVILLSWIGARPVEYPYLSLGQFLSVIYFSFFLIIF